MTRKKEGNATHDFPHGLAQPALRALRAAGYVRLDHLTRITESDLLEMHGMGPKAIGIIRAALRAKGKLFAKPNGI